MAKVKWEKYLHRREKLAGNMSQAGSHCTQPFRLDSRRQQMAYVHLESWLYYLIMLLGPIKGYWPQSLYGDICHQQFDIDSIW